MNVYNNIEILQITFTGNTDRVYFPQNSKVSGKKINEIVFYFAPNGQTINSPLDGSTLLNESDATKLYTDIVNDKKEVLQHNIPVTANYLLKNNVIPVNDVIDLELCALRYVDDVANIAGKCILVYVFYDTIDANEDTMCQTPLQSVTIEIPVSDTNNIQLSAYIDDYILASGKTVKAIESITYNVPFYLDMQDFGGRSFRYLPWQRILKPSMANGINYIQPVWLNDFNVDFENSYVIIGADLADFDERTILLTLYF